RASPQDDDQHLPLHREEDRALNRHQSAGQGRARRMALRKPSRWRYGDSKADIRAEILRYSEQVGYPAEHYADAACPCGGRVFSLYLDDTAGVASRVCVACDAEAHPIGDSAEYL